MEAASEEPVVAAGLVRRIEAGDREAEAAMVSRYSKGLLYLLRHLSGDHSVSEELHQETFRVVLEKVRDGQLREPEKLAAFLRGTARNLWFSTYRRAGPRAGGEPVPDRRDPAPGPLSRLLREEEAALARRVVAEMTSDRDRQVLLRFCLAEEDKDDVCADLGLTSLQFNVVLFRARQRFKKLFERALKEKADSGVKYPGA